MSVNTLKVQTQHPKRTRRRTTADSKLGILKQTLLNKYCLFVTHWVRLWINYSRCLHRWTKSVRNDHTAQAGDLASCVMLYCPHVATIRHAVLRVVFEVIQIYYGDSKNWTSALLRGALSLLRPELSKIMKPTAKSCLASARTGKAEASVFPSKVRLQKMID